ncbi:MAG: LysR family transcriptional regulator [Oscillospiraceae bacterium]|nr:LysR family transcriptional regulator [Oscillospiraceae bacterium]
MLSKTDRYFLTIAKEGNLNRAAEVLYVSQPSLTKYVQRLERQLGAPLFDRSVSPMRLNDAGRRYLQYVMEQNALEEEMLAQIAEIGRMERGTLRLGIPAYCGQCYLPRVLKEFGARYPAVALELFEGRGEQIECAVADQQIDLGIVHLPVSNSALHCRELFSERVLLAVPGGEASPDAKQNGSVHIPEGTIADFSEYSFIMPHPGQKLGKIVSDLFCRADFTPKVLFNTQNIFTVLSMAAAGLGAGFVPAGGLSELPQSILSKVTFFRLKELDHDNWKLVALQRKGQKTPAYTDCFIRLLSQYGHISNRIDDGRGDTQLL